MMQGMVDLETLGTTQDAVVLTIGAAKFNPFNTDEPVDKLYLKLDTSGQVEKGRIIDDGTLKWWGTQSEEVRNDTFSEHDRVEVKDGLLALNEWFDGVSKIWCQGPSFDFPMLGHLYRHYDMQQPWKFWNEKDARTVTGLIPDDIKSKIDFKAHNAIEDVIAQCKCVQYVFNVLDIQRTF